MRLGIRNERGTDCCDACRKHNEIDMGWLTPNETQRRPGTPGVIRILCDVTPSVSHKNRCRIHGEALGILSAYPQAKIYAFGQFVKDITRDPSQMTQPTLWDCFDLSTWEQDSAKWKRRNGTEGTYLGRALAVAAKDNPSDTIVLSDGGTADKDEMFRIADRMTGNIHAFFCEPRREEFQLENYYATPDEMWSYYTRGADKRVMQELARRGGGEFDVYPRPNGKYIDYGIRDFRGEQRMRRPMPGGNVVINGPGVQRHVVYEDHHIVRQRRFFYEDGKDEHIDNTRPPEDVTINMEPTQVQYREGQAIEHHHKPQGLLDWIIRGSQPQALPQREQNRGELRALPQPSSAPALPPPAQSLEEAVAQGADAKRIGKHPNNNPYKPADGRHGAWMRGWSSVALPNHSGGGMPMLINSRQKVR